MKRLIAFSSVAHMGFVMLGIATLTTFGINAAIFGMVAHGLITGMLFFVAGTVKERYHTLEIRRMGGMLKQTPRLGWILGFCAMASLGLPGLAGFWGEFPAILSAYSPVAGLKVETFRVYMVVAAIGTVLAAGYLLWLYQRTVVRRAARPEFAHDGHIHDVESREWIAWTPLLVGILVLGVYPNILFKVLTRPSTWRSRPSDDAVILLAQLAPLAVADGRLPRARARDHPRRHDRRAAARRPLPAGAAEVGAVDDRRSRRCWPPSCPILTLALDGDDRVHVQRRRTSSTTSRWC